MRKVLIIFAVLLALSVGVIVSAAVNMDAQHENITVTEETLFGDPAAAEGLSVSTLGHRRSRLFWHTSYDAGADPQPETEFTYSNDRIYEEGEYVGSFNLSTSFLNGGMSGSVDLEARLEMQAHNNSEDQQPLLALVDVASRAKAGEEYKERVRLADYYTYFLLGFHFTPRDGYSPYENEFVIWEYLNSVFKIPVPEDLLLDVTITKDAEGRVYDVNFYEAYDEKEMVTHTYTPSAIRDDGVFFGLFGNADFSQIEGGYGLYYMPIGKLEEVDGYSSDMELYDLLPECRNIYPMELSDCEDGSLMLSADEAQVYALTKEQGEVVLTVFDGKTCEILQQIRPGTERLPEVWRDENVVALVTGDENWENFRLQVYLVEDGLLELWLDTELYPNGENGPYWYVDPVMSFDGQRLAIVQYFDHYNASSHRILIYDKTGLQYAGNYHHGGDEVPDRLRTWYSGLQIKWK